MRFIVTGIEMEGPYPPPYWPGAGPGDKVGLLIRRIPDNCDRPCNSNIPDPAEEAEDE